MPSAVVIEPGEGELVEEHIRVKLDRPELSVNEVTVGPEFEGAGPHYHERHVDTFYVLEGELEFLLGTETLRAGPGTSVAVPPGIVHGFTSSGPATTRYLNLHTPDAGFIDFLRRRITDPSAGFDSVAVDGPGGPAEAEIVEAGGGERLEASVRTITVRSAQPQLCFLEFEAREGFGPISPHRHGGSIDSFYVLEGELGLWANGAEARFGPGSFVAAPAGEEHGILRVETPVRFLNFHAPDDGFAAFIRGS
ncbi:MAG TPA: cupin domain-containing protein [Gaiellaceae bacterium]|nr:cupin domain-containing protein [Gaiellaceae bacterium]